MNKSQLWFGAFPQPAVSKLTRRHADDGRSGGEPVEYTGATAIGEGRDRGRVILKACGTRAAEDLGAFEALIEISRQNRRDPAVV